MRARIQGAYAFVSLNSRRMSTKEENKTRFLREGVSPSRVLDCVPGSRSIGYRCPKHSLPHTHKHSLSLSLSHTHKHTHSLFLSVAGARHPHGKRSFPEGGGGTKRDRERRGYRCRANMAHIRQSRQDSGPGFRTKALDAY